MRRKDLDYSEAEKFFEAMKTKRLSPTIWRKLIGVEILDPDGWDRSGNFSGDFSRPLSLIVFLGKANQSTTSINKLYITLSDIKDEYKERDTATNSAKPN